MPFIQTIAEDDADGDVAELYQAERASNGYVPNDTKAFSHRPEPLMAWKQLKNAIAKGMEPRRYELATLAAALHLRSSYCALAHGKLLAEQFLSPDQVCNAARDNHTAGLDPLDVAVMDLAGKVAADASAITEADFATLRDLGCSDAEILDVILAAAARCFYSKVLDATGTQADSIYKSLPPNLRDVLTVGRPIADS